jgi:hypothetical protein
MPFDNADEDDREMILMPCFNKFPDKYRRDYGLNSRGLLYYETIRFDKAREVTIHTSDPETYIKHKRALISLGFKKETNYYKFTNYRMVSGSGKNADDDPAYFITVYKIESSH